MVGLALTISRLEGKVDAALTGHGGRIESLETHSADHEHRIRTIEQRPVVQPRHLLSGLMLAAVVLGAIVSGLMYVLTLVRG